MNSKRGSVKRGAEEPRVSKKKERKVHEELNEAKIENHLLIEKILDLEFKGEELEEVLKEVSIKNII